MPAPKPSEIARHWGVRPSYVSNLKARGMPVFESLEAADVWRAEHAPARGRRNTSFATTPTTLEGMPAAPHECGEGHRKPPRQPPAMIDITRFVAAPGTDFDALMVQQAETAVQVAHGLYLEACASQEAVRISAALKNWNEAARCAADIRERFMGLQEKAKLLAPIDRIMDVVGQQLQDLRNFLVDQGARIAPDANPTDPALAKRIIDGDVDQVFARISAIDSAVREEIAVRVETAAA